MFNKSYNNQTYKVLYKARNYSVTPLGSKFGLIQWVDGTALYSIYRRWLMSKEQKLDSQSKETKANLDKNHRPSERFNQKLIEKGITSKNRSNWPLDKLIEIHNELVEETPCDLISKGKHTKHFIYYENQIKLIFLFVLILIILNLKKRIVVFIGECIRILEIKSKFYTYKCYNVYDWLYNWFR